ncbi:glycosyltransferase family 4 protein [Pseudomonas sp. NFXW11]|uniref:glycosyltransferase family 4 protein n=1 Tax=Pseudomonas sp. NFXW11 TaxID=2819531 RepID=UPI003CE9BCA2
MDKPLKILVVSQYFWPENMRINNMVEGFVAKGHEVTILTGQPNYPEGQVFPEYRKAPDIYSSYCGAKIYRVPMLARGRRSLTLALNYLSFFSSASTIGAYKLRDREFDAIFVYAVSPIMAAIPALVIGRLKKSPVFLWVLDLWPETLDAVGVVKNRRVISLVGNLVSWIYNRADYLLLQSKSFEENIRNYCTKYIAPERIVYFPSWAEDDFSADVIAPSDILKADDSTFTIVFAGNLGDAQDFPTILQAVEALKPELALRWIIVGDGRASSWLHEQVAARGLDNVFLLGRHPLEKMPPLFAAADALLVSLKTNDVFEKTIPGKVQAYLASGKPILAMIEGEAARVIKDAGAGMTCHSGDPDGLADIVRSMAALSPAQHQSMGASGRSFYLENFSKDKLFDRLETLFRHARLRSNDRR